MSNNQKQISELKLDAFWQKLLSVEGEIISIDNLKAFSSIKVYEKIGEKTNTLEPLFYMPNLRKLTITRSYSLPIDLRTLVQLSNLKDLRISKCDVTNTQYLKELQGLEILNISHIKLKTSILKCLNQFPNLRSLNIASTALRSMKIFQKNSNIETLIGSYSKGIKNMPKLKSLFLLLRDQVDIENCPNLEYLRISRARKMNNLDNLTHLNHLLKLEIVNPMNEIDLSVLHQLNNLEELYLDEKLKLRTMTEPMKSVKRLTVTENNKHITYGYKDFINDFFPNATVTKYESFSNFIDKNE